MRPSSEFHQSAAEIVFPPSRQCIFVQYNTEIARMVLSVVACSYFTLSYAFPRHLSFQSYLNADS